MPALIASKQKLDAGIIQLDLIKFFDVESRKKYCKYWIQPHFLHPKGLKWLQLLYLLNNGCSYFCSQTECQHWLQTNKCKCRMQHHYLNPKCCHCLYLLYKINNGWMHMGQTRQEVKRQCFSSFFSLAHCPDIILSILKLTILSIQRICQSHQSKTFVRSVALT